MACSFAHTQEAVPDLQLGEFAVLLPFACADFLYWLPASPLTAVMEPSIVNTLQHALHTVEAP